MLPFARISAVRDHFLSKGEGKVRVLNAVVVTDFDVHAMWLCRHVEQYFVALEETKAHLKALGVPEALITTSGIPVDPVFAKPKDKRAMRRKHGLDDRFTILVSAGGFGVGRFASGADACPAFPPDQRGRCVRSQ